MCNLHKPMSNLCCFVPTMNQLYYLVLGILNYSRWPQCQARTTRNQWYRTRYSQNLYLVRSTPYRYQFKLLQLTTAYRRSNGFKTWRASRTTTTKSREALVGTTIGCRAPHHGNSRLGPSPWGKTQAFVAHALTWLQQQCCCNHVKAWATTTKGKCIFCKKRRRRRKFIMVICFSPC